MQNFEFLKYVNFQGDENWNDKRTFYFNLSKKRFYKKYIDLLNVHELYIYIFFWIIYRSNDWYGN